MCILKYTLKFKTWHFILLFCIEKLNFYKNFKNEVDTNPILRMERPWDNVINPSGVTSHWLGKLLYSSLGYLNLSCLLLTESACDIITAGMATVNPTLSPLPEIQLTITPPPHLELIDERMARAVLSGCFPPPPPRPNPQINMKWPKPRNFSRSRNLQWLQSAPLPELQGSPVNLLTACPIWLFIYWEWRLFTHTMCYLLKSTYK